MNVKDKMEIHEIVIDGEKWRMAEDVYTGDWFVECVEDKYPQPIYLIDKESAVMYILNSHGMVENNNYETAPDRTSA